MNTKKGGGKAASLQELERRVAYLGPHGLLMFQVPRDCPEEQLNLAHKIGLLDKRAHRELGFGTPAWEAVIQLLVNAISLGVNGGEVRQGRELLGEAQAVFDYYRTLTTRNRLLYLAGLLAGILVLAILGATVGSGLEPELSARQVLLATTFAGLGSLASVLSRLKDIDELEDEHSKVILLISGASRPIVAAIIAVVATIALDLKIVTIHVGKDAASDASLYLVASFLCGFSERFASEILGKIVPQSARKAPSSRRE